jgi:hypothetical protein
VSTFSILQTLLGIINSRKNKFNPTGPLSAAASSDPSQADVAFPLNPAVDPLNATGVPVTGPVPQSDMTSATAFQENASNIPLSPSPDGSKNPGLLHGGVPRPSPIPPPQGAPQTEDSLRQQLQQADLYDLSGEKAAAEALKRDDAFKQQQIDQKAEQTKEFFAGQDQKQQQILQDTQKQADLQLHEQQEKEFWDVKKSQEMQVGMNKELLGLHEAARQAHQEWRNDFTQGVCRDDVAALYDKDITDRVGQYKARLDDIGTNPVDKVETIEKYKVKLTDEVAPQVEQKTAELHQEHFPEFQSGQGPNPSGPGGPGEPASSPSGHSSGNGHAEGHGEPEDVHAEPKQSGPGVGNPDGGPQLNMPAPGGRGALRRMPNVPQSQDGGGSGDGGGGDSDKPAPKPNSSDSEDDFTYHALRLRQKLEEESELHEAEVLRAEHPLIVNGVAAVSEAVDPDFSEIDEFNRHPDKIYGEGEKEFEEHELNPFYGRKGAESAEALQKGAESAWDPTSETAEHMSDLRFDELHAKAEAGTHHDSPNPGSSNPGSDSPSPNQSTGATPGGREGAGTETQALVQDNKGDISEAFWKATHTPYDLINQVAVMGTMGAVIITNKYGNAIQDGVQDLKDNMKISSNEEINKLVEKSNAQPESDQNKVMREAELNDKYGIRPMEPQPEKPDAQTSKFANPKGPEDSKIVSPDAVEASRRQHDLSSSSASNFSAEEKTAEVHPSATFTGSASFGTGGLSKLDADLVRMLQARAEDLGPKYTGPNAEEFAKSITQKNQEPGMQQLTGPKETLLITDQRPEQKLIADQSEKPLLITDQSPKPLLITDQRGSAPDPAPAQPTPAAPAPAAPAVQPPKPHGPSL